MKSLRTFKTLAPATTVALKLLLCMLLLAFSALHYVPAASASCQTPWWADEEQEDATCGTAPDGNGECYTDTNPGGNTMSVCYLRHLDPEEIPEGSSITTTCGGTTCERPAEQCWDPYLQMWRNCQNCWTCW